MLTDLMLAQLRAQVAAIKADRLAELEHRELLAGGVASALSQLYAGRMENPAAFLAANGHALNVLQKSAGHLLGLVRAAKSNWAGGDRADDAAMKTLITPGLIATLATDLLVGGKAAVLPMLKAGRPRLVALAGYLRFIYAEDASTGQAEDVEAVVQVLPTLIKGQQMFEVRVYSTDAAGNGQIEIYPPVEDWANYLDGRPRVEPQAHARGRLPVAVLVGDTDAYRQPVGLVAQAAPAFLRYLKTAVERNATQENAGAPERVIYSDDYLRLVLTPADPKASPIQAHAERQALANARKVSPRQLRVLGSNDRYEVKPGVDITPHLAAESADRRDVESLFGDVEAEGGNLSGVALAERRQRRTTLVEGLCGTIAGALTDALGLLSLIPGANTPAATLTLTPSFPQDNTARAEGVSKLYSDGLLPKSSGLRELQNAGYSSITDEQVRAAEEQERASTVPALPPVNGQNSSAAPGSTTQGASGDGLTA